VSKEYVICDNDTNAPDFFDIPLDGAKVTAAQLNALTAYIDAMDALGRIVLIRNYADENKLYFSSHPDTITLDGAK